MTHYLDANLFIYAFVNEDNVGIAARNILGRVVKGEIKAVTSFLTYDEFFWGIRTKFDRQRVLAYAKSFLEIPRLEFVQVDDRVIFQTQDLLEKYSLDPRDAIHLASALVSSARVFITQDFDLENFPDIKIQRLSE